METKRAISTSPDEVPPPDESLPPSSLSSSSVASVLLQVCGAEGCVVCCSPPPVVLLGVLIREAKRVLMGDFGSRYLDVIRGSIRKNRA